MNAFSTKPRTHHEPTYADLQNIERIRAKAADLDIELARLPQSAPVKSARITISQAVAGSLHAIAQGPTP